MEKSRKPREESGTNPSRRVFLQRVAGTGVATVAGLALLPSLTEAGKGSTQVPTATGGASGQTTGTTTGTQTGGATSGKTTTTPTATPVAAAMGSDAGVLNFLLTLERLEAAFYNLNGNKAYLTGTAPVTPTPTTTTGTTTGTAPTVTVPATTASNDLVVLKSLVNEISAHENSHVALLEQILGTSAQAAPTFQNLDAPTLQQFLTMAQTFEDVGVSAYEGQIPLIQDKGILATVDGIQAIEGRHAGGLRVYRKLVSTAEGGDPNTMLTEDGQAVNPTRTMAQVLALIAPYIVGGTTTPTTTPTTPTTPVTPTTTTPTTTSGGTTGGMTGTTSGGTNNTPAPGNSGTATVPNY